MVPLKIGTPDQFSELRESLRRLGYSEEAVSRRTGSETIYQFKVLAEDRAAGAEIHDALDVLIRLLMDEEPVEETVILAHLPARLLELLSDLDVVVKKDETHWHSTVVLYPVAGLYVASDRTRLVGEKLPADAVYAAITGNTGRFLSIQPEDPGDDFLDLCCGTGVAALLAASRGAKRAWAADLGQRSVHFSDFNAKLNGLLQVTAVQGDLFGAVDGQTFDCVVAHPPYVPDASMKLLFRDGGEDGEQIFRRIIQDLPRYLKPGGRFYCVTTATDRENELLQERIRLWLGETSPEFDVILVATEVGKRPTKVLEAVVKAKGKLGQLGGRSELYERLKVTAIFYGTVVLERAAQPRAVATARTLKAEEAAGPAVEWFRKWEQAAAQPSLPAALRRSRPRLAQSMQLQVTHKPGESGLEPSEFKLKSSYPFVFTANVEPWLAVLVGMCAGQLTTGEIFDQLQAQDVVDAGLTFEEFCDVVRLLISNGFLELGQFPLPRQEAPVEALV
ncbi:methyltransferase [uncultured Paludibaculum sp.]|uniref:methyltransferase n=1 Tax=uncultured Paludibaculum sp. TaxID=1765020 RepID=UPI002AAB4AE7|nr:methyltransferase [uncultured Paludibaculum sp.]